MSPFLPLLIALCVGGFIFAVWQFVRGITNPDGRKLAERLSRTRPEESEASRAIFRSNESIELSGLLSNYNFTNELHRTLLQSFPDLPLRKFLMIAAGSAMTMFLIVALFTGGIMVSIVGGVLGGVTPFLVVTHRKNKRQRLMADQLPDALDFLSRVLKAGHSISTGFQLMGEELPDPIAGEFRRVYEQHSLGTSLEDALRNAVARVDSTDFAFFVTAVLIQRQTGGDLSEVLGNIGGMIRHRVRLQQHVKAKTAEGRFTGYILAAFPAVMFVVSYMLNPAYAGRLLEDSLGKMLLGGAFALQMLGLFVIRKITTVKV